MAKLYFRYGAMNSGKTLDIIKTHYNYAELGINTMLIKSKVDSKGDTSIVSRNGSKLTVDYLVEKEDFLLELLLVDIIKKNIKCIFVDEVQFMTPSQIDELGVIVDRLQVTVMCYGLRTDFQTTLFPASRRLLEIADEIEELRTLCRCGEKAIFNTRKVNGKFVFDGEQVAIDGFEDVTYVSLCRNCYQEEKEKQEAKKLLLQKSQKM